MTVTFEAPTRNQREMERERELVAAACAGDPAAFAVLVRSHRPRVTAVVARMVGSVDAEDVVQEALLRAYLSLSRLRRADRFGPWLCGIAINLAKMRLRWRAAQPILVVGGEALGATEERDLLRVVQDAVELLPPGQRDVVLLHYVDDLSCDEVARLLGTSPGAVRVRLHRARAQLRRELAPLAPVPIELTKKEVQMVEVKVEDVIVRVAPDDAEKLVSEQRIILLGEEKGERLLPIWIGAAEGNALAFRLTGDAPPRPTSSDLMVELLRVSGAGVQRVAVTELRENTFYATISLAVDGCTEEVDARPSDAINLAVRLGAPILVDGSVLSQASLTREGLVEKLDCDAEEVGTELAPGEWKSLSAELLRSLHAPPGR